jgi:inner membrane protein
MDNLTHSLIGALFGQMGLKRKTGLAMPTLIIAANIPDIDAVAVLLGGHQHLAIRRGLTHGPIAMVLLPLLLWGAMICFDNWQTRRGKRPEKRLPLHKGWLLALAVIGCLSHPLFDWFNSYGIRLLEPFSSQWFYGDTLFIIDIWIWAALIAGVWLSLRRERADNGNWRRPAVAAFGFVCLYIFANGVITNRAENAAIYYFTKEAGKKPEIVVANPVPVAFWMRDMILKYDGTYMEIPYSTYSGTDLKRIQKISLLPPRLDWDALAQRNTNLEAFLFWSRLPFDEIEQSNDNYSATFKDARFSTGIMKSFSQRANNFAIKMPITKDQIVNSNCEQSCRAK